MLRSVRNEVFCFGKILGKYFFQIIKSVLITYANVNFFSSYFSQLLEEHGPLDMSNKMFSEEYEFFPEETRQILEKAGGLKSFLLGCPRFVVIDNCIALKKVALRLKKKRKKKNIKTKVEEISKTGEYLRVKLPLNPAAREFKPDVKSKPVSDLSSAPASEDLKPQPTCTNSAQPACEAVKPKPISDNSSRSVSEDAKPKGVSSDPPKPVSEEAGHKQVSNCPKPILEDVKPTYWPQPHLVTGYCTYLPFRGFDITQTPPAFINVLPTMPQYSIYTPLATVSSEYQLQRSIPVVPSFVASDITDVRFEGHHFIAENAPGHQIVPETQILQDSSEIPVKPQCLTDGADTAPSESNRNDGHCGNSAKWEENPENTDEVTDAPRTQMVAIQVRLKKKKVFLILKLNFPLHFSLPLYLLKLFKMMEFVNPFVECDRSFQKEFGGFK